MILNVMPDLYAVSRRIQASDLSDCLDQKLKVLDQVDKITILDYLDRRYLPSLALLLPDSRYSVTIKIPAFFILRVMTIFLACKMFLSGAFR